MGYRGKVLYLLPIAIGSDHEDTAPDCHGLLVG